MEHITNKTGGLQKLPVALNRVTKMMRNTAKAYFSRTLTIAASIGLLAAAMLSEKADAQLAQHTSVGCGGTCTTINYAPNVSGTVLTSVGLGSASPCGSGGLSGKTNNGVYTFNTTNGHVEFTVNADPGYVLNISDFSCKLRRSNSGLQKVRLAYQTTGGIVNDLIDKAPDKTSCGGGSTVNTWNTTTGGALPTGVTSVTFFLYPYDPVSSGGVIQFNDITISGTVSVNPVSCPSVIATGTVTPSSSAVCAGSEVDLNLDGASTGSAITYQWQSSPSGAGTWSDISGATNTMYAAVSAPTVTTATDYRVVTTCTVSSVTATSSTGTITVNPAPDAGTITAIAPIYVDAVTTMNVTGASSGGSYIGIWSSGTTSVAAIDPITGELTANAVGETTLTYTVTNTSTGCDAFTTQTVGVVWPETLALYKGTGGASTDVIVVSGAGVSALSATDFGAGSPCSVGGLSGITVPTTVVSYDPANPHVSFVVTPDAGNALNINSFWAWTRCSGSGPTKARLAYRIGGGSWIDEGVDHDLSTGGSCGAASTTWQWVPAAALSGVTSDIEFAIFPFSPGSSTGTFQANLLEITGVVTPGTTCTATPTAGVITPSVTVTCTEGYAHLTFEGDAGPGISYSWEQNDGSGWTPIAGASNIYYTSPVYTTTPTSIDYRVISTCAATTVTATSAAANLSVNGAPAAITDVPTPYLYATVTTTLSCATAGGTWSSSSDVIASIDELTGEITGAASGIATITYSVPGYGCYTTTTVAVIADPTIALYLGTDGTSTATTTDPALPGLSTTSLVATGFGSASPCAKGGLSGITVPATVTSYDPANPNITFTITGLVSGVAIDVTDILVTARRSGSGPANFAIAYDEDNDGTWDGSMSGFSTDDAGCGAVLSQSVWSSVGITSVTGTVKFGIFPYNAVSDAGSFQLNAVDILGAVTCPALGNIQDVSNGVDLNGESFDQSCVIDISCSPAGGTWSTSGTAIVTPGTGGAAVLTFSGTGSASVTYTDACGVPTIANVNASTSGICDGSARPSAPTTAGLEVSGISIYPNPAKNTLNIAADQSVNVEILSMDGRMLLKAEDAKHINVSDLASGLYLVKIYDINNVFIRSAKFSKQ